MTDPFSSFAAVDTGEDMIAAAIAAGTVDRKLLNEVMTQACGATLIFEQLIARLRRAEDAGEGPGSNDHRLRRWAPFAASFSGLTAMSAAPDAAQDQAGRHYQMTHPETPSP